MEGRPAVSGQAVGRLPIGLSPESLVNTVKAAEIAGVTDRTIRNWMRDNLIVWYRTPGRGVRILVASLFREGRA